MAESVSALIRDAGRIAATPESSIANLTEGAQLGLGSHLATLDAATPLTLNMAVPIVLHTPGMFNDLPHFNDVLKALVEKHAKSITGIDFEYQLEGQATPVGHDGQQLYMPTRSMRSQVTPQFTWQEVQGNLVWNFIRNWITMMRDPDTQASMSAAISQGVEASPQLMSSFSMDVLFIQFDATMRPENIIDGFIVSSMWPQQTGMLGAQREPGQVMMAERSVSFYGIVQHNINTKRVAQQIAEVIGMHRVNYDVATPVANQIANRLLDKGVQQEVSEAVNDYQDIGA